MAAKMDAEDDSMIRLSHRLIPAIAALALVAALPGCAPRATGTTVSARNLGSAAYVSYGTIVGTRPVQVAGSGGGVGTAAGAVAGGLAGSFIGGDVRSNLLAGLGGALIGGLAGTAVEGGLSQGNAIEFIVREDGGGDIAVVQTNEQALQAGDRVVITRGDRVRLSRAAGAAPAPGYAPPAYAPSGYAPQQYAPQGYAPQGYVPQGYAPQAYDTAPAGYYRGSPK
jgi:outer membrane lipoprotein SlyB